MTRTQIIEQLFTGEDLNNAIAKMRPADIQDDLRQEIALRVCEMPDDKVVGLWQRGELKFYVVRSMIRLAGDRGRLLKSRVPVVEFTDHYEKVDASDHDRETREALQDIAISEIDNLYWYDAELLRMYMKLGTFRAIEEETGIPFESCYKNIRKSLRLLRERSVQKAAAVFSKEELHFIQNTQHGTSTKRNNGMGGGEKQNPIHHNSSKPQRGIATNHIITDGV